MAIKATIDARRVGPVLALLALSIVLSGCVIARGSGTIVSEDREASGFDKVEVHGSGKLVIEQGSDEGVTVRADDNLMQHIRTDVEGDTLVISVGPRNAPVLVWPTESIRYTVRLKDLTRLTLSGSTEAEARGLEVDDLEVSISGSGKLRFEDLDANTFDYGLSGSGSADVSGSAEEQTVEISGSGSYTASDLESKSARVRISGSGSAELWVQDDLDVEISGSGSVEYYGSPTVNQDISGSGSVKGLGEK